MMQRKTQRGVPATQIVEAVLGCKWTLALLDRLEEGINRPGQLQRAVPGLSKKVMNERLKKLGRFGLIERKQMRLKPLHVEYRLNRQGRALLRVIASVRVFAKSLRCKGGRFG